MISFHKLGAFIGNVFWNGKQDLEENRCDEVV
jgi:hypothetical protein